MEFNNWKGRTFSEVINDFADFLDTLKEVYYNNKDIDLAMMKKQNDMIHDLEFLDFTYHQVARWGLEVRSLRRNRREYKNEYLLCEDIKNFYKDKGGQSFINELRELADSIDKKADMLLNQTYTERCGIDNITEIKKDSDNKKDRYVEDLILLNRVLNKYCIHLESSINEDSEIPLIKATMYLDSHVTVKYGKTFIHDLGTNIEKFFRPSSHDNISSQTVSSDMLIDYPDSKEKYLTGNIRIFSKEWELYVVHVASVNKNVINFDEKQIHYDVVNSDSNKKSNKNARSSGKKKGRGGRKKK